ncbi:hypothetical protein CBL_00798 [Carabus blaptoides fortunei]
MAYRQAPFAKQLLPMARCPCRCQKRPRGAADTGPESESSGDAASFGRLGVGDPDTIVQAARRVETLPAPSGYNSPAVRRSQDGTTSDWMAGIVVCCGDVHSCEWSNELE